jgi:hypothetical protein
LVQGLTLVFNALLASFVAFAFFETLATLLTKYAAGIAAWAQMISFLLLFILVLAVLQTVAMQLGKEKIDLGLWPERVGRIVCGIILGYIITGNLLLALATSPLPSNLPYARFAERNPDPTKPSKPAFSPDGFVASLFGAVSKGSFAAMGEPQSFAVLHADYLDHLYLNRLKGAQSAPLMTSTPALSVSTKASVWEAPTELRDTEGQAVPARGGENLMFVRVGIKKSALKDAGKFTLSQLRLICVPKGNGDNPLAGKGQAVFPIGYIGAGGKLERKSLDTVISIKSSDVPQKTKEIDFAFYVPNQLVPALIGFKKNNLEKVSKIVSGEGVPQSVPFGGSAPSQTNRAAPDEPTSQRSTNRATPSNEGRRGSGLSPTGQALTGGVLEDR